MPCVIHHNPACGTSRNVLAILEAAGAEPTIIEYLNTGWTRPQLLALFAAANLTPGQALRIHKTNAAELGLTPESDPEALIEAMIAHPILVNRPIVATPKGVRMCRPSALVLDLLEQLPAGPFALEDGTPLIDAQGVRLDTAP